MQSSPRIDPAPVDVVPDLYAAIREGIDKTRPFAFITRKTVVVTHDHRGELAFGGAGQPAATPPARVIATRSCAPQTRTIVAPDSTFLTRTFAVFPPSIVYGRPILRVLPMGGAGVEGAGFMIRHFSSRGRAGALALFEQALAAPRTFTAVTAMW